MGRGHPRVVLALGSNLGDRREYLRKGVHGLAEHVELQALSRLVESEPWGPIAQPRFLNLVVRGVTHLAPLELLDRLQAVEDEAGRQRILPQGPRTLDVDLVFYGSRSIRHPRLVVPHPHWRDRPFVRDLLGDVGISPDDPLARSAASKPPPPGTLSPGLREVPPLEGVPFRSGSFR